MRSLSKTNSESDPIQSIFPLYITGSDVRKIVKVSEKWNFYYNENIRRGAEGSAVRLSFCPTMRFTVEYFLMIFIFLTEHFFSIEG